ncbi:squalene/phytoene synthase family protein [Lentzea sp. HUAS12]|uniref:phytoene/squalene synthase family protein n=1 Tax=Lentzea sp. HUAS12 TaxID=2951806 RepID=UPI00353247EB
MSHGTVDLGDAYAACRRINARYGRTFFLATTLLRPDQRPAVHALYAFARWADEIVDAAGVTDRAGELDRLERLLEKPPSNPVLHALADTRRRYDIDGSLFTDFLASMRMDLDVTEYADLDALGVYVHGSAEVIGLQMLPVLGTVVSREEAAPHAARLGVAFQLTNFLRDVGEDLDRGRVYLPQDVLGAHGVDRDLLQWCRSHQRPDTRVRRVLDDLVAHSYAIYRSAEPGIEMLSPASRPCVRTAYTLYRDILGLVGCEVLWRRVAVPNARRLAVALPGAGRALVARLRTPGVGGAAVPGVGAAVSPGVGPGVDPVTATELTREVSPALNTEADPVPATAVAPEGAAPTAAAGTHSVAGSDTASALNATPAVTPDVTPGVTAEASPGTSR